MTEIRLDTAGERLPISIEEELKRSYLDYAMSVIIGRALPDVRDGLKPVHRRILYGMWDGGHTAGRAYKKSARIVGDVMGKYHPHGDQAIYDTMVRMAQAFAMRHTLVDGQGNFGSIDGDAAAAMRYTEVRLKRIAHELLGDDIDMDTVDWAPNYDGSIKEPLVLPARFPNLLVNGSTGIAVGMATNIPPHNLGEVIDACLVYVRNPESTAEDLMGYMPGPDFPTGGFIHGRRGLFDAYTTGRGTIKVRARALVEHQARGKKTAIIVRELPYQVNKARLVEQIASLVQAKRLEGISDLRDESDRDGIRVVIELKRDAVPEVVLNNLYKLTQMQTSFGVILLGILNKEPKVFNLRELIHHFIEHRKEVVVRRTRFQLDRALERAHILEGLVRALDHLDEVIALIRAAKDPAEAKTGLVETFAFTEVQAQSILDMRLQRLTGLEREKIIAEYRELLELIEHLRKVLDSESMVLDIISEELLAIKERYAEERRTEIISGVGDLSVEDLIAEEEMVITVTRGGYIKRTALSTYRAQRRGGRGRRGMGTKQEDVVKHLFVGSTHATLLFFTSTGRVFARKVHEIPQVGPASRGRALVNFLSMEPDETVAALLVIRDFGELDESYLLFATRKGKVKRTELAAYANIRSTGIRAVAIDDGDDLLGVHLTNGTGQIFLGTHGGMGIRFAETDVRPMGRVSAGVRGINLRPGDWVEEAVAFEPTDDIDILVVTDLGLGKRTPVSAFRLQRRGGFGVTLIRLTERNGSVAGMLHVQPEDQILAVTSNGMLIRTTSDEVRRSGRATQGVRVIRLDEGDTVVAIARSVEREEDDELAPAEDEPPDETVAPDESG